MTNPENSADATLRKLDDILRHVRHVQEGCERLGRRIIERDTAADVSFGVQLIANSRHHDNSKFFGLEFDQLSTTYQTKPSIDTDKMLIAVDNHRRTNDHHPEYWHDIGNMPDIKIAEMVCDWYARATEAGTNLRDFATNTAPDTYKFPKTGRVAKKIKEYLDLLLDPVMKRVN